MLLIVSFYSFLVSVLGPAVYIDIYSEEGKDASAKEDHLKLYGHEKATFLGGLEPPIAAPRGSWRQVIHASRCTPCPCCMSPVHLASSQRSSLAPSFVLLAWLVLLPAFSIVIGGGFAFRSLPLRRPLPHIYNTALILWSGNVVCFPSSEASSPNAGPSL
jgi:hypothetical protein